MLAMVLMDDIDAALAVALRDGLGVADGTVDESLTLSAPKYSI